MQVTRTEIYDLPDSGGWWWNENETDPFKIENLDWRPQVKIFMPVAIRLVPGPEADEGVLAKDIPGKWQKVKPPIWPSRKKEENA